MPMNNSLPSCQGFASSIAGSVLVPTNRHTPFACRREASLSPSSGSSSLQRLQTTGPRMMQAAHKDRWHSTIMSNTTRSLCCLGPRPTGACRSRTLP